MLSLKLHKEVALAAAKHYQLTPEEVDVTLTRDLAHGDYTTNVALKVASKWGVTPREAAETILEELNHSHFISKQVLRLELAGPGFINFTVKPEVLLKELATVGKAEVEPVYKGQRVIVEYSSPNIAKPMHIGHLRSTIIGQAVSNLYEELGAKVVRINHLGDWGTQFGKLIAAFKMWGSRAALHRHPIEELLKLYVKFHEVMKERPELEAQGQEEFRKLEQGDKKNRALWQWFRTESLREFEALYKRLGVKFTYVTGESFYEKMLPGLVASFLKQKLAIKNADGSVVAHLEGEGLPPALIQKSDGVSLYATRDLAAIHYRVQHYKPNTILYVVGNEQALHFEQVFACAEHAGYVPRTKLEHLKNGLVLGEDGLKLATREGKIIKLDDVLAEVVTRARAIVDKKNTKLTPKLKAQVAEVVGVGALKYNDLSQNRHTDITFNWDRMLAFDGNSGPYLQYTYVRLRSILRKALGGKKTARVHKLTAAVLHSLTPTDVNMLRLVARYPEAVLRAARENGPHLLAQYLYELATATNSFYHGSPVLNAREPVRAFRLQLIAAVAEVLKHGLSILGIGVVERM